MVLAGILKLPCFFEHLHIFAPNCSCEMHAPRSSIDDVVPISETQYAVLVLSGTAWRMRCLGRWQLYIFRLVLTTEGM